jgi:hypothetical protein
LEGLSSVGLRKWIWLSATVLLALPGAGLWMGSVRSVRPTLNLQASDDDGQVRIEWDKSADPVISAESASVLIVDGGRKSKTALTPDLLRAGNLVYRRQTADLEIRLRVYPPNADPVQELTRLTGLPDAGAERIRR